MKQLSRISEIQKKALDHLKHAVTDNVVLQFQKELINKYRTMMAEQHHNINIKIDTLLFSTTR
jgi:spore maturation protein CgeB